MIPIEDSRLLEHARRVDGKVVVLTGGANGIGRETAILLAQYGAKLVIGDIDGNAASMVVQDICKMGHKATYLQCNVLHWDDQVALFEHAISHYGSVDVVIPIAGMPEHGSTCSGILTYESGEPVPPDVSTLQVNLFGAIYTVHLGLSYLKSTRTSPEQWKAVILMGSMASWEAIPLAPMYTASKYAIRGLMRSIYPLARNDNIRVACIDPTWADTQLLPASARLVLIGTQLLPVARIAQTILHAAVDPDDATSGCSWLLLDDGPVMRLERENIYEGTYGIINNRIARFKIFERDMKLVSRQILGIIGRKFVLTVLAIVLIILTSYW